MFQWVGVERCAGHLGGQGCGFHSDFGVTSVILRSMGQSPNSNEVTAGVRVEAAGQYVPERSDPDRPVHFYAYRIRITNEGEETVQLLRRRWEIRDAYNNVETVSGDGVVGHEPSLAPGGFFEYTSFCPLKTQWGTMEGAYTFADEAGHHFDVAIGRFFLVEAADNRSVFGPTVMGAI